MNQPVDSSMADFAGIAGFKRSYVTALKAAGRLVWTEDGKRIRVAESLALIKSTADPSKVAVGARHAAARLAAGGAGAGAAATDSQDSEADPEASGTGYAYWRERNERAKALASERENRIADGELLSAGDVQAQVSSAATMLRTRFEGLPDVLGPQLAAVTDEGAARAILADAIEHALDEASRQFAALGKAAA